MIESLSLRFQVVLRVDLGWPGGSDIIAVPAGPFYPRGNRRFRAFNQQQIGFFNRQLNHRTEPVTNELCSSCRVHWHEWELPPCPRTLLGQSPAQQGLP